jgi:hypothetical protein
MATRATRLVTDDVILNAIGVSQGFSGGAKTLFRQTVLYRYTARTFTFRIANWAIFLEIEIREKSPEHKDLTGLSAEGYIANGFLAPSHQS